MPDNQVAVEFLANVKGAAEVAALDGAMKKADTTAKEHNKTVEKHGQTTVNALGMSRREWMRTGSEASFYLQMIAGKSGEAGKSLGQMAGVVTQLGESAMFGGAMGVGIAAFAVGISALAAKKPEIEALDNALASLGQPKATTGLTQLLGVTEKQAAQMLEAAKESESYRKTLAALVHETEAAHSPTIKYVDAFGQLVEWWKSGTTWGAVLTDQLRGMIGLLPAFREKLTGGGGQGGSSFLGVDPDALAREAEAMKERTRQLEIYRTNIPAAAKEMGAYRDSLDKLSAAHKKATDGFAENWTKAESDASAKRIKLEVDTAEKIESINENLRERLRDMAEAQQEELEKFAEQRAKLASDSTEQITKAEKNATAALTENWRKMRADIDTLDRETGKGISKAHTEREKAVIAQEAELKRKAIRDEAARQREQIATQRAERQAEIAVQRAERSAELVKQEADAARKYQRDQARAEKDAEKQREATRKQAQEQSTAIEKTLKDSLAAITKQRAEEAVTYQQAQTDAKKAHQQRIKDLTDTRTEQQKINAAIAELYQTHYPALIAMAREYRAAQVGAGETGAGITYSSWQEHYRRQGFQTEPGQFRVIPGAINRPVPIIAHGGEVIGRPSGGNTFYIYDARDPNAVANAVARILERERNR